MGGIGKGGLKRMFKLHLCLPCYCPHYTPNHIGREKMLRGRQACCLVYKPNLCSPKAGHIISSGHIKSSQPKQCFHSAIYVKEPRGGWDSHIPSPYTKGMHLIFTFTTLKLSTPAASFHLKSCTVSQLLSSHLRHSSLAASKQADFSQFSGQASFIYGSPLEIQLCSGLIPTSCHLLHPPHPSALSYFPSSLKVRPI